MWVTLPNLRPSSVAARPHQCWGPCICCGRSTPRHVCLNSCSYLLKPVKFQHTLRKYLSQLHRMAPWLLIFVYHVQNGIFLLTLLKLFSVNFNRPALYNADSVSYCTCYRHIEQAQCTI